MKKLAVLGDFLEPHHHAQIDSTAARCGFAVDYYPDGHVPAELAGQYEVLYGMPDRAALRTFTSLKWFCGNFAGVDAYLDDALYPSPDRPAGPAPTTMGRTSGGATGAGRTYCSGT